MWRPLGVFKGKLHEDTHEHVLRGEVCIATVTPGWFTSMTYRLAPAASAYRLAPAASEDAASQMTQKKHQQDVIATDWEHIQQEVIATDE